MEIPNCLYWFLVLFNCGLSVDKFFILLNTLICMYGPECFDEYCMWALEGCVFCLYWIKNTIDINYTTVDGDDAEFNNVHINFSLEKFQDIFISKMNFEVCNYNGGFICFSLQFFQFSSYFLILCWLIHKRQVLLPLRKLTPLPLCHVPFYPW